MIQLLFSLLVLCSITNAISPIIKDTQGNDLFKVGNPLGSGKFGTVYEAKLLQAYGGFSKDDVIALKETTTALSALPGHSLEETAIKELKIHKIFGTNVGDVPIKDGKTRFLIPQKKIVGDTFGVYYTSSTLYDPLIVYKNAMEKGFAHKDLNKGNIIVSSESQVFLIDFGFSTPLPSDPIKSTQMKKNDFESLRNDVEFIVQNRIQANKKDNQKFIPLLDSFRQGLGSQYLIKPCGPNGKDPKGGTDCIICHQNGKDENGEDCTPPALTCNPATAKDDNGKDCTLPETTPNKPTPAPAPKKRRPLRTVVIKIENASNKFFAFLASGFRKPGAATRRKRKRMNEGHFIHNSGEM